MEEIPVSTKKRVPRTSSSAEGVWTCIGFPAGCGTTRAEKLPSLSRNCFCPASEKVSTEIPEIMTVEPSLNSSSNHESGASPSIVPPESTVPILSSRSI